MEPVTVSWMPQNDMCRLISSLVWLTVSHQASKELGNDRALPQFSRFWQVSHGWCDGDSGVGSAIHIEPARVGENPNAVRVGVGQHASQLWPEENVVGGEAAPLLWNWVTSRASDAVDIRRYSSPAARWAQDLNSLIVSLGAQAVP